MKKLLSILLILVLGLAMTSMVYAADGDPTPATVYTLAQAKLDKELTVADGINIDAVKKFTFSFTFNASKSTGYDATADADNMPTISALEVEVGAQSNGVATGSKALSDVFGDKTFPHAGEYAYDVVETTSAINSTADGITKKLTVDSTKYRVRVYVKNSDNGPVVDSVTVAKVSGSGDSETEEKVDPTKKGFIFKNEYSEVIESSDGVLTVTKSITGSYADKTKKFPVSVVLVLPKLNSASDVAVAEGVTWNAETLTASLDLADGGTIKFTKLPAGTTFTVKETQQGNYQSKVTGYVASEDSSYQTGDVSKAGKAPVTAKGNEVAIENNLPDIIPTGVIIRNLPYVLLVLTAAAGLVYLTLKKRMFNN